MKQFDFLPDDMDIPAMRRNENVANTRWLLRNLHIRNGNHPKFRDVIKDLQKLVGK